MKNYFILLLLINFYSIANGQVITHEKYNERLGKYQNINDSNIISFTISTNSTVHIVSPEEIKYVDISSTEVDADMPSKNIVRLKAKKEEVFFVTIVTNTFISAYKLIATTASNKEITEKIISINPMDALQLNPSNTLSQTQCNALALQAIAKKRRIYNLKSKAYDMQLWVNNIFIIGDYLLFDIGIKNKSKLQFDIDEMRFKIKDKFLLKSTVSQDIEIEPFYQFYNNETNDGIITGTWRNFIMFKKFTYPTQKIFLIELTEKQISGRKIELNIDYNQILSAKFLQ